MGQQLYKCWNARMFEYWNGGLEGLGGLEFRGKRWLSACGAACKREEKFRACENKTLSASRIVAYCAQSSIFTSAKNYEFAR